jgi:hypothetical protein
MTDPGTAVAFALIGIALALIAFILAVIAYYLWRLVEIGEIAIQPPAMEVRTMLAEPGFTDADIASFRSEFPEHEATIHPFGAPKPRTPPDVVN